MVGEHRGRRPFIACSLLAVPVLISSMRLPLRGFAGRRWWGVGRWTGGWLAQPKPAATSRPGPSLAAPGAQERSRSGGARGFLGPNSSPIPIVTRRCQTSHCGWLRDDDAPENRTLVPLCGADAIAGGRVNAVTIVDAGFFPFAPSKRRRSCAGCVWVGKNPSLRRWASVGNWTKSMAKLDAQEIKQRANPQPGDNPASCRLLAGHYLLLAAGDGRDSERTWSSVSLLSSHPGIYF